MYYLWACDKPTRHQFLDYMKDADMKVLRIFVTHWNKHWHEDLPIGCYNWYDDIESNGIGVWNDTILTRIDTLLEETYEREPPPIPIA